MIIFIFLMIRRDEMDHVLVFFSSYCDFVRVRNWFKTSNLDYAEISEYTKDSRMAKVRFASRHGNSDAGKNN